MRQAILQMKVQGEYQLAGQLAGMLANLARSLSLRDRPVFVPVPRLGTRQQGDPRHFPSVACGTLAESCNGDSGVGLLLKTHPTPLQTQLSDTRRLKNVDGAFELSANAPGMLHDRTVIIVDDVLTTGATICAATSVILQARPHQCLYLTLALSRATMSSGF
ncbi:MAG: phosphoribosyltransferase family protein [Caldiserica bacterium]|nr:phosphoribosyltransferase family protein [Caldisericota bacterium]